MIYPIAEDDHAFVFPCLRAAYHRKRNLPKFPASVLPARGTLACSATISRTVSSVAEFAKIPRVGPASERNIGMFRYHFRGAFLPVAEFAKIPHVGPVRAEAAQGNIGRFRYPSATSLTPPESSPTGRGHRGLPLSRRLRRWGPTCGWTRGRGGRCWCDAGTYPR